MTAHSTNISLSYPRHALRKVGVFGVLLRAHAIWRERQQLASLDAHLLNDIGVTKEQADAEAERPVWDAPARWFL